MNIPGKNPARKTPIGNLLHVDSTCAAEALTLVEVDVELVVEVLDVVVRVAEVDEVLLLEGVDAALADDEAASVLPVLLVLAMIAHLASPVESTTHWYPKGQHLFPHVGNLSPNFVVNISAAEFLVMFCCWISQLMVAISVQLWPSGQQSPDEELSREMQLLPVGQLKLLGRSESTAEHEESSCLRRRPGSLGGLDISWEAYVEARRIGTSSKRRIASAFDGKNI